MATYSKLLLSGSVNGQPIALSTTASSVAVPIHTSITSSVAYDEIYIYATNNVSASISILTICWGGTGTLNQLPMNISPSAGRTLVCDGMLLNNGLTVYAFTSISGSILLDGFVNRIQ